MITRSASDLISPVAIIQQAQSARQIRAEAMREAARIVQNVKEVRLHEMFRGCFGYEEDAEGWINIESGVMSTALSMKNALVKRLLEEADRIES